MDGYCISVLDSDPELSDMTCGYYQFTSTLKLIRLSCDKRRFLVYLIGALEN